METIKEAVARSIREGGIDSITDEADVVTKAIGEAIADGLLTENDLDTALKNTFRVRFRLGEFDPANEILTPRSTSRRSFDRSMRSWRETTQKAIVLLKNSNGTLPLQEDKLRKVAVIGPLADILCRDCYSGTLPYAITPLQGIRERLAEAGNCAETVYVGGADRVRLKVVNSERYVRIGDDDKAALAAAERAEAGDLFSVEDWGGAAIRL